jgi:hypothetical protein
VPFPVTPSPTEIISRYVTFLETHRSFTYQISLLEPSLVQLYLPLLQP